MPLLNRCKGHRKKTGTTYVQGNPHQKVVMRYSHNGLRIGTVASRPVEGPGVLRC